MQLSRDNGSSIMYNNKCDIIELNLLTKQKWIIYRDETNGIVTDYYITDTNKIIRTWTGDQYTLIWNSEQLYKGIYEIYIRFLEFETDVCVIFNSYDEYDGIHEGIREEYGYIGHVDVSYDRRQIVFSDDKCIYLKNISKSNMKELFDTNGTKILAECDETIIWWVEYSSRILLLHRTGMDMIMNIQTCKTMTIIQTEILTRLIEIKNNIMIQTMIGYIIIYDVCEMKHVKQIQCDLEFIGYSKQYDILITENLDYYRFDENYELQCIVIGKNYVIDCAYVDVILQNIMDIILDNQLLHDLPLEILNTELYREILYLFTVNNH